MIEGLPIIYLARHGDTAWSISGQGTGLRDLPPTERGERNARNLGAGSMGSKPRPAGVFLLNTVSLSALSY